MTCYEEESVFPTTLRGMADDLPVTPDVARLSRDVEEARERLEFERKQWDERLIAGDLNNVSQEEFLRIRRFLTAAEVAWENLGQPPL